MAAAIASTPFKIGSKQIYLPSFSVVLHRNSHLGPKYATFTVPLWFSKLDLRDYLFHVYSVRIISVRSYIQQQKVVQGKPSYIRDEEDPRPQYKRWHRPKSIKRMTVELESPFAWPDPPEDFQDWSQDAMQRTNEEEKKNQQQNGSLGDTLANEDRRIAMREQAKALLEGRTRWKPPTTPASTGPILQR